MHGDTLNQDIQSPAGTVPNTVSHRLSTEEADQRLAAYGPNEIRLVLAVLVGCALFLAGRDTLKERALRKSLA